VLLAVTIVLPPRSRYLARLIALTGAVAAAYVLLRGDYVDGRLEGLGCNTNYLGTLLALPLVASIGLVRYTRTPRWLVPAAVCFIAMTDTQSRGAFLAAAAGIAFVLIQDRPVRWQLVIVSVVGVLVTAAFSGNLLAIENFGAGGRPVTELSANSSVRLQVAELAIHVAVEHPLRGIGYWMFPMYATQAPGFRDYLQTHNDYLRLAAEAGIPALILFLVLMWLGTRRRLSSDLALLRAVVVTYAVGLLFANPLANLVISTPFWVALGCLLSHVPETRGTGTVPTVAAVPAGTKAEDDRQPA
jgi:O-antigen ligase